jgi:hypothetical protein
VCITVLEKFSLKYVFSQFYRKPAALPWGEKECSTLVLIKDSLCKDSAYLRSILHTDRIYKRGKRKVTFIPTDHSENSPSLNINNYDNVNNYKTAVIINLV